MIIEYHYRGMIERLSIRGGDPWREGYSANGENGGPLSPWMTKRECQNDAKTKGARAIFVRA